MQDNAHAAIASCTYSRCFRDPIDRYFNGFAVLESGVLVNYAMRIAIPDWQGRVSPVFDMAGNVLLIDIEKGRECRREEQQLTRTDVLTRAAEFLKLGASVLICGGISAPLEAALVSSGVEVIGFVCGPVEEVLAAFLNGKLQSAAFNMPGMLRRRRRLGGKRPHC